MILARALIVIALSLHLACGTTRQFDALDGSVPLSRLAAKGWQHPINLADNISPDGQHATSAAIATNALDETVVVWVQNDGTVNQIFKSEFRAGQWQHPAGLQDNFSPDGQAATTPHVAMDDAGNVLVAWLQSDGTNKRIFKSEYRLGVWSHPASLADGISPTSSDAYPPKVAIDNLGNALIVWAQDTANGVELFMSEYRGGSWNHPQSLNEHISVANPLGVLVDFQEGGVAMSDAGSAIVTWRQEAASSFGIFKSEYRAGSWNHPVSLSESFSLPVGNASSPSLAMDGSDNAVIGFDQIHDVLLQSHIMRSEYRGGSWTHPQSFADHISPDGGGGGASQPYVRLEKKGGALIVWSQFNQLNRRSVYKSEYRAGAWMNPTITDFMNSAINTTSSFPTPRLSLQSYGGVVVWSENGPGNILQIFISQFIGVYNSLLQLNPANGPQLGWDHPDSASNNISPDGTNATAPVVATNQLGNSWIAWSQSDGSKLQIFLSSYR